MITHHTLTGQNSANIPSEQLFNFWLGKWDLTWNDAEGNQQTGSNNIERVLGNKVIQENFLAIDAGQLTGYEGKSWSVFNPQNQTWRQTWVDNQGSYLEFIGEFEGNQKKKDKNQVFHSIRFKK